MPLARRARLSIVAIGLLSCGGLAPGCRRGPSDVDPGSLPPSASTLAAIGKRLGNAIKPGDLSAMARRGDQILARLTPAERAALGASSIRFRVDRPVEVLVGVSADDVAPYWLIDRGFKPTGDAVGLADASKLILHRKRFEAGPVGLGVNALDAASQGHYAVFVRSADIGPVAIAPAVAAEPVDVRAARAGASPFADEDRPIASLAGSVGLDASMILTRRADRLDGALLPLGRAWKTHQPSSKVPDQVVASFGEHPKTELSISWRTEPGVLGSVVDVENATDPNGSGHRFLGDVVPIRSDGLLNDPVIARHRVLVDGLGPDTAYRYRVGDGSLGGWGDWSTVRTAPDAPRDFGFLYLGDAQCELERWGGLLDHAAKARPDAGFILLAGDLVDRGNERTNWDHFFFRSGRVFASIPFMPAVGNHEYLDKGPEIYRKTFDLPRNGPPGFDPNLVYAFDYGDATFAVLDSNLAIYHADAAEAQARWLDDVLTRSKATWKFVTFHHPVYASHPKRDNPQLEAAWGPIFDRHHVDLVLTGHDHAYLRTRPMKAGRVVGSSTEGTTYVVSVSGEKFYGQVPHDFTARGMTNLATYQTIDILEGSRRMVYRSFDRDGREVDAFSIEKKPRSSVEVASD